MVTPVKKTKQEIILFWAAVVFGVLFLFSIASFFLIDLHPLSLSMPALATTGLSLTAGSGAYLLRKERKKKAEAEASS